MTTTAKAQAAIVANIEAKAGMTDIVRFACFDWQIDGDSLYTVTERRGRRSDNELMGIDEDTLSADDIVDLQGQERKSRVERMAQLVDSAEANDIPLAELLPAAHYLR